MTRWAVVYREGSQRLAWLIVEGAPVGTSRHAVLEALSTWRLWPRYAAVPAGVRLVYLPESRWAGLEGVSRATRVPWAELAPAERRITLPVDGPAWARLTLAAKRAGAPSLQSWAASTLAAAADQVLAGR